MEGVTMAGAVPRRPSSLASSGKLGDAMGCLGSRRVLRSRACLLGLPDELLLHILSWLPYRELARVRLSCRRLAGVCHSLLNSGFGRVERRVLALHRHPVLPAHPFLVQQGHMATVRRSYLLCALISHYNLLLALTSRYANTPGRCFFAGSIIDEFNRLLCLFTDHISKGSICWTDVYEIHPLCNLTDSFVETFRRPLEAVTVTEDRHCDANEIIARAVSLVDVLDASFDTEQHRQVCIPSETDGYLCLIARHTFRRCWLACIVVAAASVLDDAATKGEELCAVTEVLASLVNWNNRNTVEHELFCMENDVCMGCSSKCDVYQVLNALKEFPYGVKTLGASDGDVEYWLPVGSKKMFYFGALSQMAFEDKLRDDPETRAALELTVEVELSCLACAAPLRVARSEGLGQEAPPPRQYHGAFHFRLEVCCPAAGRNRLPDKYSINVAIPPPQDRCVETVVQRCRRRVQPEQVTF